MKTILKSSILTVTAILMTAVLSSYAPPDCPPPNDGAVALFPCPEDCNKFWECSNGEAILQNCPDGLWYCSELHACSPFWDFFCNFSHCGGGTGGGGDTGGGGNGGGEKPYCYNGGPGSTSCSIEGGLDILGVGVSASCSVSCMGGYYACCGIRCTCVLP